MKCPSCLMCRSLVSKPVCCHGILNDPHEQVITFVPALHEVTCPQQQAPLARTPSSSLLGRPLLLASRALLAGCSHSPFNSASTNTRRTPRPSPAGPSAPGPTSRVQAPYPLHSSPSLQGHRWPSVCQRGQTCPRSSPLGPLLPPSVGCQC